MPWRRLGDARHAVELLLLLGGLAVALGRLVAATTLGPRRELCAEQSAGVRVLYVADTVISSVLQCTRSRTESGDARST